MDLSAIIIVALGILLFFGGVAWLDMRSRKSNRPSRKDAQPQQPDDSATSARRTAGRRAAMSE